MNDQFWQGANKSYSLSDLLKGKDLEIVAATLLLVGKLNVESVQLFRGQPVVSVTLLGQFKSAGNENDKANAMAEFLEQNGDITLEEVFEGIRRQMNKDRRE